MKYKKKFIDSIKKKYGLENLNFFSGRKKTNALYSSKDYYWESVVIASFKRNGKNVYKNRDDIQAERRLTHFELDAFLDKFSDPNMCRWHFCNLYASSVILEPTDSEYKDFDSFKIAYLITYLAEI